MVNDFFTEPVLNSPYEYPTRHRELDEQGRPTRRVVGRRRPAEFVTPIPKPRGRKGAAAQQVILFGEGKGLSTRGQQYDPTSLVNELRHHVDRWRGLPNPSDWQVTPETARLLRHWRHHQFQHSRPFFAQVEAAEVAIWLTEVAPKAGRVGGRFLEHLAAANDDANPGLTRLALKLATGAGKTTVMAMLIAWQTVNAVRRPGGRKFTRGFLVVAPGVTIRDRLRVLQPNDPDSYYRSRELVPNDMLGDLERARVVITNYHAFKLRERTELSRAGRSLLQGRGEAPNTTETEGQMIQRVMPCLMGMKDITVINDEGHHCYRERPDPEGEEHLKGDEKREAERNNEAARLWISGLEIVNRKLGVARVLDLSATPFFLRGSGYAEGTLFPWTVSDFSLMDAIESGIVKLPRVPAADNIPGGEVPEFRNLWEHIRAWMPKRGRGKGCAPDPLGIPSELQTALGALYGHYEKTFGLWRREGVRVPPCFIVVCNNTSTSKLVYDYVSGFRRENGDGSTAFVNGRLALFRNFDEGGNRLARPRTILIDSGQLESGDALEDNFRGMAAGGVERFRREVVGRTGDRGRADKITDRDLLREVTNTVGKEGRLGESVRCVVSVSMLTEGWDANTVTHILGVRAFGTQLLCEQVIGRALRRQSYELNERGLFNVEYADVLGIPFDFTARPVLAPPQPPRETVRVRAVRPERDHLEIRFPRVQGYRVELPRERLTAEFDEDSVLELTPDLAGKAAAQNACIVDPALVHTNGLRRATLAYHVTRRLLYTKYRDRDGEPELHLFGQLKRIVARWLDTRLVCNGGTYPAQLVHQDLADMACERIHAGVRRARAHGANQVRAVLDPYNPAGSTAHVNFDTSNTHRRQTDPRKCHVNRVILDGDREAEFCRVAEGHARVKAYVKNHGLGLEVPYRHGPAAGTYAPDFVVLLDDGRGAEDPLHLVVELRGFGREDAQEKRSAVETHWVPGVNNLGGFGRWAFAEFIPACETETDFAAQVEAEFGRLTGSVTAGPAGACV
ncbi:MAG TPA: DEAD/DEAH box helicase family protein [Pyrinomonadaceae bacterium]|jgi:type III restriction enzyme